LPFLPNSLKTITSQNNQLAALPELPDTLYTLNISNNPITCLPQVKFIGNFSFNNTQITCFPNYGEVLYPNPSLAFYPLCDTFNSNGTLQAIAILT
jgi:Leucine-rich repeat (LRR) protein